VPVVAGLIVFGVLVVIFLGVLELTFRVSFIGALRGAETGRGRAKGESIEM